MTSTKVFWSRLDALLTALRPRRRPLILAMDAVVVAACWNLTYLFRLGFERWWSARPGYDHWVLLGVVAVYLAAFLALRVQRGIWRFSGFGEIKRLTLACGLAGLVAGVIVILGGWREVPRAVLALHPIVTLMGLASVRIAYRTVYEQVRAELAGHSRRTRRALVMGAGDAARLLLAGIQHQGWVVVGLLDDDPSKHGARVGGCTVVGRLEDAPALVHTLDVTHVIIAMPAVPAADRKRVIDIAVQTGRPVLTVPTSQELLEGALVSRVRDIAPEDLLGREPVQLDEAGIAECIGGKTVLITGAGGSIGSELCRQVARYKPARLVLYELSEFNLYTIEQQLGERFPELELVRLIGDVKDIDHLRSVMAKWPPQIVFHAAAFKHVPLMEDEDNAWAALRNNTLGTYNAALASAEAGAERFVLISTDKAVNPTNVMGATKRAAELVVRQLAKDQPGTKFMAVRFGNVLGSSGSVVPKFKEQIARGGPVTVTHPDVIRYFMTIPEAARLVVQAATIGESGQVLVLEMGEPVRIVDLARDLIRLAGLREEDVGITFVGLRPGEKLSEELLADADRTLPTTVERVRIAELGDALPESTLTGDMKRMTSGAARRVGLATEWLGGWVPEYRVAARQSAHRFSEPFV